MMRWIFGVALAFMIGCSSSDQGTVKGQLFSPPGTKISIGPGEEVFMSLVKVGGDGKADMQFTYPCAVEPDGSFSIVASGGLLPPGSYRVAVEVLATKGMTKEGRPNQTQRFKGKFTADASPIKVEVKAGSNDLKVEIPGS